MAQHPILQSLQCQKVGASEHVPNIILCYFFLGPNKRFMLNSLGIIIFIIFYVRVFSKVLIMNVPDDILCLGKSWRVVNETLITELRVGRHMRPTHNNKQTHSVSTTTQTWDF